MFFWFFGTLTSFNHATFTQKHSKEQCHPLNKRVIIVYLLQRQYKNRFQPNKWQSKWNEYTEYLGFYTHLFCCTEMRWLFISSTAIWVTGSDTGSVTSRARTELTSSERFQQHFSIISKFCCTERRWLFISSTAIWVCGSDTGSVASRARTELITEPYLPFQIRGCL